MKYNKYLNAIYSIITAPYILKGKEREAFGFPYFIHKFIHKNQYKAWEQYRGIHKNERCFIIGTGPSLQLSQLKMLKNEITFSVNSIINCFENTDWRPTYYCITDPRVYETLKPKLEQYSKDLFSFYPTNRIKTDILSGLGFPLNCSDMYKAQALDVFTLTKFGTNPQNDVYDGATVVYALLQIAVFLGFTEIYLLGVDCNYGYTKDYHNQSLEYNSPTYVYRDTKNTGRIMIEAFKIAQKYAMENGISIFNASSGGKLNVFDRINLCEVLQNEKSYEKN